MSDLETNNSNSGQAVNEETAAAAGQEEMTDPSAAGVSPVRRVFRILLPVLLAVLLAVYGYGWYRMRNQFLLNTTVNGLDYSGMTAEEAEEYFKSTYMGRTLTVTRLDDSTETLSYDDFDYHLTSNMTFRQLIDDQDFYLWPLSYCRQTVIETEQGFAFDREKLEELVYALDCIAGEDIRDPADAFLEKKADGYVITPEDDGNRLDGGRTYNAISDAVNAGASEVNLEKNGCYHKAQIRSDNEDLQASLAAALAIQGVEINVSVEGGKSVLVDKSVFLPWMSVDGTNVNISSDAVVSYTAGLAETYNTYGKKRSFRTNAGDTVTVGGSDWDNFGYKLNQETSAAMIRDAIMSGESQTIALDWSSYGRTRDDLGGDFGSTYIEISLDQQYMWYYRDGEVVVETRIVSGLATPSRATPPGVFCVLQKLKDHTMQGSYGSAFSNYVMAIMTNGICIHDSSWRGEYGSDIWLYDGSHGCINTPYSRMKALYENADVSTPVIIYDRANTVTTFSNETYTG
ncbi:MAG: L,D-transpeptidase family protein [Lachnospiraceae bacterium]|nr:L,D-transpeptidase family protein [Lachnospiraceae bacterium]